MQLCGAVRCSAVQYMLKGMGMEGVGKWGFECMWIGLEWVGFGAALCCVTRPAVWQHVGRKRVRMDVSRQTDKTDGRTKPTESRH